MRSSVVCVCTFILLALNVVVSVRHLESSVQCPSYGGPRHSQKDLEFKVTYLSGKPSYEQTSTYNNILEHPMGTIFGSAVVYFSTPMTKNITSDYFNISGTGGKIIGLKSSESECSIDIDFLVSMNCSHDCIPSGVCIGLNTTKVAETGLGLPFRKGCRSLRFFDKPACLKAEMFALSMGKTENGVVYTNETQAKLIMIVEGPLRSTFNFKAEDFNITGPQGTTISNVNTMNATPFSASYSIQITHGTSNGAEQQVEVCFKGSNDIRSAGMPFVVTKVACAKYMTTSKEPKVMHSSMILTEPNSYQGFCK